MYILVMDGCGSNYGVRWYIVGVYDSLDKAQGEQIELERRYPGYYFKCLGAFNLNETFDISRDNEDSLRTVAYVGGYVE